MRRMPRCSRLRSRARPRRFHRRLPINTSAWDTPEAYASLMKLVPYERIGEPEDIGNAAVFLASDMADYITGTSLFVDGGMTLYPGFATGG